MIFYIIFYVIINNKFELELFDEKINRTVKEKCGIICTKVFGCAGFSTDNKNTCYLSKSTIVGNPTKSPFSGDYNKNNIRCNKISTITDITLASDIDLKKNATYICTSNETSNDQIIKIYDTKEKIIDSPNDLAYIPVDKYSFEEIDWGKEINLDDNKDLITNPEKIKYINLMTEYEDEYLGQYMYPHKCTANISQFDCMKHCLNNDTCLGTEWNHMYVKKDTKNEYEVYRDVCCPKIKITKIIPRRDEFKYGHFYVKEKIENNTQINNLVMVNFGNNDTN